MDEEQIFKLINEANYNRKTGVDNNTYKLFIEFFNQ